MEIKRKYEAGELNSGGFPINMGKTSDTTTKPTTPDPVVPASPSANNSYSIAKGDTLSSIAKINNTTVDELMRLNPDITNPNLIYAGRGLNLPNTEASKKDDNYSDINSIEEANNAINQDQADDIASGTDDEIPTRKTVEDLMGDIETITAPDTEAPEAPNYTEALNQYREDYGVVDLENQLNTLKAEEQEIYDQRNSRISAERGKSVAMNVINGRIGQVEQQENERLAIIQRSIANATNQLNTKYNTINTLMTTKEMDYNSAVTRYDKEMANNISMYNSALNLQQMEKSDEEIERDNARSNAQISLNAYASAGLSYEDLSDTEKINLTKLGVQSGLGPEFFSNVLKVSGNKEILTNITSSDNTMVSIIYKDGTTQTIPTGLKAKVSSTDTTANEKKEKEIALEESKTNIKADVEAITGPDGYVDPTKIVKIRNNVAINDPDNLDWFDNAYEPKYMLDPNNADYTLKINDNNW